MKASPILHLLVVALSIYHVLTSDGCGIGSGKSSVRCGKECTGPMGECTCGKNAERFNHLNDTIWCCNASNCKRTFNSIKCDNGTLLPLTTPCQGECNTGRSYSSARQYWACDNKEQCIKIQHVEDGVHHCLDRSDERKRNTDNFSPIQWDKLTTCNQFGYDEWSGLKCSGQGEHDDCMLYSKWCNEKTVLKCLELGGRTSVHTEVCSNNTFWADIPCTMNMPEGITAGRRCTSEYSGQCYYPGYDDSNLLTTCRDRSHDILPMLKNGSCPLTYFSCLVDKKESCLSPYLQCDIHPQCDDGKDEKNCKYIYKMKRLTKASGTMPCHHLHYGPNNKINKPEVEILALPCDGGKPECAGGVDEMCGSILTRVKVCE